MIPRVRPTYTRAELRAALFPLQDAVEEFERELAASFGMKYALAFPYGRSAIYATFRALDFSGEVVQPAYNCVVVAHATVLSGNRPVFVDCQSGDPNQDADAMIRAVNSNTTAVLPTSIFGIPFDAHSLVAAIRRKNPRAFILMDCAQSFSVRSQDAMIAAQGDAAILAFGIGKAMTTLLGGALLTNRDDVAQTVRNYRDRSYRVPGRLRSLGRFIYFVASWIALTGYGVYASDYIERPGMLQARFLKSLRSRESIRLPGDNQTLMTAHEASIGRTQLPRLSGFIRRRQEISALYRCALHSASGVRLLDWPQGATHTIYALRLDDPSRRTQLLEGLRRRGVQGGTVLDYVVPDLDCYREHGKLSEFPNARAWACQVLNLPNHPTLSDEQVAFCAAALRAEIASEE